MENKTYNFLKQLFWVLVFLYAVTAAYYYLTKPGLVGGDEGLFRNDIAFIKDAGWIAAIEKSISIPYMLLVYPFSIFLENHIALRLVNVLILFLFVIYLFRSNKNLSFLPYLLFYTSAVGFFYFGTNDTLFTITLSVFLIEVYKASNGNRFNFPLAISALILATFTRELILIYIPLIFYGLYILIKNGVVRSKKNYVPIIIFGCFIGFNIPSLVENGRLSYDHKASPEGVTWAQLQYLAQLKVNNGSLDFQQHPSWADTLEYLKLNGDDSLPKGILNGLTHDIRLTFKEFFKDLFYVAVYHSRTLGFIVVTILFVSLFQVLKLKKFDLSFFVPFAILMMASIISLIIISFVELRWLAPIFILSIISYSDLEKIKKIPIILKYCNLVFMLFFSLYGMYGIILKIL